MGGFRVQMQVGKIGGDGTTETVAALVDTGVTFATLPASLLHRLGIKANEPRLFRNASGEIVECMTGDAFFQVEGRSSAAKVVFGPENHYVMGMTTLGSLQLDVDPVNRRLVSVAGLL